MILFEIIFIFKPPPSRFLLGDFGVEYSFC